MMDLEQEKRLKLQISNWIAQNPKNINAPRGAISGSSLHTIQSLSQAITQSSGLISHEVPKGHGYARINYEA